MSYQSDESGRKEWYVVSLSMSAASLSAGPDRQRVPVEEVDSMSFSPAGDELLAQSTEGDIVSIPIERRGGGNRLGSPVRLFSLPSVQASPAVGVGAERLLFLVDPEAERETLPVLLNWRSRVGQEPGRRTGE